LYALTVTFSGSERRGNGNPCLVQKFF